MIDAGLHRRARVAPPNFDLLHFRLNFGVRGLQGLQLHLQLADLGVNLVH